MSVKLTGLIVATSLLAFINPIDAFWRMPCRARSGLARLDPLMNPGEIADHLHAIHGGSNFGIASKATDLKDSACTTCGVTQDKSAYWTPSLHFLFANGTSVIVDQIGGMLAYYMLNPQPSWPNPPAPLYAFPDGFQMIAGEKTRRNYTALATDFSQDALSQRALGFNCLNYTIAPEPSLYRHFMPNRTFLENQCGDGLRLELAFPSCWNGVDIDSADHKSHMAYPSTVLDGYCPPGFQTKTPTLFFETIWNVWEYKGYEGEYYLSTGDPTGYGYHGDFQMGWSSTDFLQQAVNNCTNLSGQIQDCPLFDIQPDQLAATCSFPIPSQVAYDNAAGPRLGLPVGVPIQSGPAQASLYPIVSVNSLYQSFTLGVQSMESTVLISTVASNSNSVVPTIVSSNIQNVTQPVLSTTPVSAQLGTTATTIVTSSSSRKTSSSVKVSSTATAMPTATITSIVQNTGNGAAQGTAAVKPLSTVFTTLATEVLEIIYVQTTVTVTSQAMVYEESDGDVITYRKKREEADEEEEGEEVEQEEQKQESIHRHLGVRHWFNHF